MNLGTAMMYAELHARFPFNGSAFSYVYATFGELAAWIVGWNLLTFYLIMSSGPDSEITALKRSGLLIIAIAESNPPLEAPLIPILSGAA